MWNHIEAGQEICDGKMLKLIKQIDLDDLPRKIKMNGRWYQTYRYSEKIFIGKKKETEQLYFIGFVANGYIYTDWIVIKARNGYNVYKREKIEELLGRKLTKEETKQAELK